MKFHIRCPFFQTPALTNPSKFSTGKKESKFQLTSKLVLLTAYIGFSFAT